MKRFLIRLFNLEKIDPGCPSCRVYQEWNAHLNADNEILRRQLEQVSRQAVEDKEVERADRKELEDVVLKFVRIKSNGAQPPPEKPLTDVEILAGKTRQPLRPGTSWGRIKAQLEEDARKKAEYYKKLESDAVQAGKLKAPNAT